MKNKIDLKIFENADLKTLEAISSKYRAVDDKEAEKIFRCIMNNNEENYKEVEVYEFDIYNHSIWRKAISVALSLAIVVGITVGGTYYYSLLKNKRNIENDVEYGITSSSINTFMPIPITEEYKGPILGIENWHIQKNANGDQYTFIDDDKGLYFLFSGYNEDKCLTYLSDLDNDGNLELICNSLNTVNNRNTIYQARVYRLRNGIIEAGVFSDYEAFEEENENNLLPTDFNTYYDPKKNKIILTNRYYDTEYELELENFSFDYGRTTPYLYTYNMYSVLGVKNYNVEIESITSDIENIRYIDDKTGEVFVEFTGYIDKTNVYFADLDNDKTPELVCNYQYGENLNALNDHVKIYRRNKGVLECGEFLSDFESFEEANNIDLTSCDDFSEIYYPEKEKIILKKNGDDNEYELDMKYYHFEPIKLESKVSVASASDNLAFD